MSGDRKPLLPADMTDDQRECYALLCDLVGGAHHITGVVRECGRGIRVSLFQNFATFDSDLLTRAVILAHDRSIRIEVEGGGPRRVGLSMWKRKGRAGSIYERHPSIEDAIKLIRNGRAFA